MYAGRVVTQSHRPKGLLQLWVRKKKLECLFQRPRFGSNNLELRYFFPFHRGKADMWFVLLEILHLPEARGQLREHSEVNYRSTFAPRPKRINHVFQFGSLYRRCGIFCIESFYLLSAILLIFWRVFCVAWLKYSSYRCRISIFLSFFNI